MRRNSRFHENLQLAAKKQKNTENISPKIFFFAQIVVL